MWKNIQRQEIQEDLRKIAISLITASIVGMFVGGRSLEFLFCLLGFVGLILWYIGLSKRKKYYDNR